MDLQAELAAKLGLSSAAPMSTATGEGSEFESSIAPSESVSAVGTDKHGKKKRKKKKKKHKDKGLTEDDHESSVSKSKGTLWTYINAYKYLAPNLTTCISRIHCKYSVPKC